MTKDNLKSILLNVTFILSIFAVEFFVTKSERDSLVKDNLIQNELISENKNTIDTLKMEVAKLNKYSAKLINEVSNVKTKYYERTTWEKEYEQRLDNLKSKLEEMATEVEISAKFNAIPFQKEFGTVDDFIKVTGRYDIRTKDDKILDTNIDLSVDGNINLPEPEIKENDKYSFTAFVPDINFEGLRLKGSSKTVTMKPPRNQISIGPMVGVTYNQVTGLTEPIWGFGVTYNLVKLWDWR